MKMISRKYACHILGPFGPGWNYQVRISWVRISFLQVQSRGYGFGLGFFDVRTHRSILSNPYPTKPHETDSWKLASICKWYILDRAQVFSCLIYGVWSWGVMRWGITCCIYVGIAELGLMANRKLAIWRLSMQNEETPPNAHVLSILDTRFLHVKPHVDCRMWRQIFSPLFGIIFDSRFAPIQSGPVNSNPDQRARVIPGAQLWCS